MPPHLPHFVRHLPLKEKAFTPRHFGFLPAFPPTNPTHVLAALLWLCYDESKCQSIRMPFAGLRRNRS